MSWPQLGCIPYTAQRQLFHSLDPIVSTTERLAVLGYGYSGPVRVEDSLIFQTLASADRLRTLILTNCSHPLFTNALDPKHSPSNLVLCSHLEELILYIEYLPPSDVDGLIKMAKNRASSGAKLSSITIVETYGSERIDRVFKLREYVTHVEYRVGGARPAWDDVPGESSSESR